MTDHATKSAYPADAPCAVEGCGHRYDQHSVGSSATVCGGCDTWYFPSPAWHNFEPRCFAGGTYSPEAERAAYERALRGE